MNMIEYPDRELAAMDLANTLAGELKNCLLRHPSASFAVPGGTTPGPVFDVLCAASLDWSRVHVMPTDERWVPLDDPRSNAGLIQSRLITERASEAQFRPLYVVEPEAALASLEETLAEDLPISVLLLGMGADMHTASLFPGADGLARALSHDAPVLTVQRPDTQAETRISFSARVLEEAMSKHLVIFGADKREALERAKSLPPEEAPINAVLGGMTVHWAE